VHDYCIPLAALTGDESAETAAFARWSRQYQGLLEARGWIDAVLAQSRVHATAVPGLEIVGFDHLTPLQEALLTRWEAQGLDVRRPAGAVPAGSAGRVQCINLAAEVEAATRWAAALLDGRAGRRVAIVVPDLGRRREEIRRIVERVLVPASGVSGGPAPETRAFELAAARPLAEQPVVAAALDILELFMRPPDLQAHSRLLRNPFVGGADIEAAARARLDARLRRFESPGLSLASLERLAVQRDCPVLATGLAAGRVVMSNWPDKDAPSNCSNSIFNLLSALGWPGADADSNEHQAEQRWRSLVSELGACDEFTGRVTRAEAVGMLREMAGRVLFEPQELRAPLLVIDPDTCAGMHFDALWVCGLDASRWPAPAMPDPFLPRTLQRRHGVPRATAELAAQESRTVLERLRASAPQVILSVPEMEDDAPLLPSPLLAGVMAFDNAPQWPEARVAVRQHAERPALESVVDATLPPISAEEARRGGARLLELQSACPLRAQAELRLGARALDEPAVGVDAAERGDLVHRALALVWSQLGEQRALLALDPEDLQSVVQSAVGEALGEARRSADELMRHLLDLEAEWLEARVLALLDADRARPPFVVQDVEQTCTARIGALTLELRPDRVDRLADGSLALIDYKTGSNAEVRAWLDERPKLPQLPAYVQALEPGRVGAVAFARVRSGDTGYAGFAHEPGVFPALRAPGDKGWPRDCASWEELLGAWRRRLEALAAEYAAGDARLAPDPARACEYCHLGTLCRIAATGAAQPGEEAADE
jgi:probable DNA repair protein